jgi:hypothetical protein
MKTLLSIIAAFALMFAFSIPAMASTDDLYVDVDVDDSTVIGGDVSGSAVANEESMAIGGDVSMTYTLNSFTSYDNDHNAIATAELKQVNTATVGHGITSYSGKIKSNTINKDFAGIANANLNTGLMSNQAIQNTIAVSVSQGEMF